MNPLQDEKVLKQALRASNKAQKELCDDYDRKEKILTKKEQWLVGIILSIALIGIFATAINGI